MEETAHRDDATLTALLREWGSGDTAAFDRLVTPVYARLHQLASKELMRNRNNSLSASTVVHEAYLRLRHSAPPHLQNRAHFYALASRLMRFIVVDHLRAQSAGKRKGELQELADVPDESARSVQDRTQVLDIHTALNELSELDERVAKIVELRFFAGLSLEETADTVELSVSEVKRKWTFAKAWIQSRLSADRTPSQEKTEE